MIRARAPLCAVTTAVVPVAARSGAAFLEPGRKEEPEQASLVTVDPVRLRARAGSGVAGIPR